MRSARKEVARVGSAGRYLSRIMKRRRQSRDNVLKKDYEKCISKQRSLQSMKSLNNWPMRRENNAHIC